MKSLQMILLVVLLVALPLLYACDIMEGGLFGGKSKKQQEYDRQIEAYQKALEEYQQQQDEYQKEVAKAYKQYEEQLKVWYDNQNKLKMDEAQNQLQEQQ